MDAMHRCLAIVLMFASMSASRPAVSQTAADTGLKAAIQHALEQRQRPELIAGRVADLIRSAEYRQAENILSELLVSRPVDIDGFRLLEHVYQLLSSAGNTRDFDLWCKASPFSHFPFTIRGMHYYERARALDGANQTRLLDERQRRNFDLFLRRARLDLLKAHELNPQDPGPPAALTALSIQLKQSRAEMEQWFSLSVSADPSWLGGYQAKLAYLAPWRYGSEQMMTEFALRCYEDTPPGNNTSIITLDWMNLQAQRYGASVNTIRFLTDPGIYPLLSRGLDRHIEAFPLSPRIDTYRSLKMLIIEQPYVSIVSFSDALQHNPDAVELLKGRIETYLATKQFSKAEIDIQALERLQGPTPFSRANMAAILYRDRQDLEGASLLYRRAIADEPSSYRRKRYLLDLGELNRSHGHHLQAIDNYSAAIREDALFEEAYLGRARSQYALGNLDAALADLILLKSNIGGRLAIHARALINTYISAQRDKLRAQVSPQPPTESQNAPDRQSSQQDAAAQTRHPGDVGYREHLIRGLNRFYQEQYEEARQEFYRTIAANPGSAQAYYMLATIAEQVDGDYAQARIFHEQAFRLDPANRNHLLGVSRSRYRNREFAAAVQSLSTYLEALETSAGTKQGDAPLYYYRGLCLTELGNRPEALSDMKKALQLDPQLEAAARFIDGHAPEHLKAHTTVHIEPLQINTNQSATRK